MEVSSVLPDVRVVQIAISQLFQMVDLLTRPESVRSQTLLRAIRDPSARRRARNRPRQIGSLGKLHPVSPSRFWDGTIPDQQPGTSPLSFLPFELALPETLKLGVVPGSSLEAALGAPGERVVNQQVSGRLRIYPPGTGVVQISVTLTFREAIEVECVASVAQHVEDLFFMDPAGKKQPPSDLFLDVIEQVDRGLFLGEPEGRPLKRLWQPPHTVFSLRDTQGFDPEPRVAELARLMSLAPGNEQQVGFLERRLRDALRSSWRNDRTVALAAQDVALLIAGQASRDQRTQKLELLADTRELVSAAAYAEYAFIETLGRIVGQSQLEESWLPGGANFDYLRRLVENMLQVMQAISSLGFLRTSYPVAVVNTFARDVWTYSNPVRPAVLRQRLDQVERWLVEKTGPEPPKEIADLREHMRRIRGIEPLFPYPEDPEEELPAASAGESPARKVRIFCCYAHKDEKLRLALVRQLGVLQRKGFIEVWSDHRIMAGEPWEDKISENLEKADLILLLISPSFVASDYSWGKEMTRALERYKEGTATVVPVLLRPVINWQETPFASLQTVPEKAVSLYHPQEAGLNSAAEAISQVVKKLRERP